MFTKQFFVRPLAWAMIVLLAAPPAVMTQQPAAPPPASTQQPAAPPTFKQEELDQILAPIALYPDPLVAQILMASTFPLEVVQAERFAKQNASLKGEALTKQLESQSWDASVKSLVNFPQVLTMMNDKLDWTQKLGDAFIAQQKPVLDTIQRLRAKAQAAGNLKTTKEQTVIVEEKIIKIEPASPEVIYVPSYNPTVVYGAWAYPAYPPYYYYPPGYVATTAFAFASGVALGAAWGYAWGNTNYNGGDVNINNSRNTNINTNINRQNYSNQTVQQRYNQASPSQQVQARQAYRGHTGSALTPNEQQQAQQRAQQAQQQNTGQKAQQQQNVQQGQQQQNRQQAAQQAGGASQTGGGERAGAADRGGGGAGGSGGGAFEGVDRGGSSARSASQQGSASRGGGGGGGARGGGGGGRRR